MRIPCAVPLIIAIGLFASSAFSEVIDARSGRSSAAIKLQNEGQALLEKGDYANAFRKFDEAVRLDPTLWAAYYNRAVLNLREHKFQQAIDDATATLRIKSTFARAAVLRAGANAKLGNYDAAIAEFNHVIDLGRFGNGYASALNDSAWLRATCPDARYRNGRLALQQAALACRITWDRNSNCLDTLAAANAELGNFDAAIRVEQMAVALRQSTEGRKKLEQHMAAFKQHQPWRENSR